MKASRRALALGALIVSLGACAERPAFDDGPRLTIEVAPLQLAGVQDACWSLSVANQQGQTVFDAVLSSSRYGDGAGSLSYVGTCDASDGSANNVVTLELLGIYGSAVSDCASPPTSLDFQSPGVLTKSVTCLDNADVRVVFDVTVMRQAQQGFFDIAVDFDQIFCSAKVDCCVDDDHDGTCEDDIRLLFDSAGSRSSTVVVGFACAAGNASADTHLFYDDLEIVCGVGEQVVATIVPEGDGNLCGQTCPNVTDGIHDLLYQVGVYRGKEGFSGVDKVYWNVALGVNKANFPAGESCWLRTRATADDANDPGGAQGGIIPAGAVYPVIDIDVELSDGTPWACAVNPLNGAGSGTTTGYTSTTGGAETLAHCYDPEGLCGAAGPTCDSYVNPDVFDDFEDGLDPVWSAPSFVPEGLPTVAGGLACASAGAAAVVECYDRGAEAGSNIAFGVTAPSVDLLEADGFIVAEDGEVFTAGVEYVGGQSRVFMRSDQQGDLATPAALSGFSATYRYGVSFSFLPSVGNGTTQLAVVVTASEDGSGVSGASGFLSTTVTGERVVSQIGFRLGRDGVSANVCANQATVTGL